MLKKNVIRLIVMTLFGLIVSLWFLLSVYAASDDTVGSTGSITITRHANEAAKAFAAQNYKKARDEYRIAIGLAPETLEFYYGLYDVCVHSGEWDQVAFALDKIFTIDPSKKQSLLAQYGEALFRMGRYDEAVPVLKQALKEADLPAPKISLVVPAPMPEAEKPKETTEGPAHNGASTGIPVPQVVIPPRPVVSEGTINQFKLTFENASHSECIVIADYVGYQENSENSFFHPPIAKYRITKILKGPPLNRDLPIRYEFTNRIDNSVPKGWKFGEDKMPKKGSQWLIFIRNAVPRDDAFDTYQGAYGRQPADEENLNKIYSLLENSANR